MITTNDSERNDVTAWQHLLLIFFRQQPTTENAIWRRQAVDVVRGVGDRLQFGRPGLVVSVVS
jgi:hypothetical protein